MNIVCVHTYIYMIVIVIDYIYAITVNNLIIKRNAFNITQTLPN
jgi:hypothetical protein